MNKKITSVNTATALLIGLALVVGVMAGIAMPVSPQAATTEGGAQALPNYFRNVVVKPADDTVALSMTLYTTPTVNPLSINDASGTSVFNVSPVGDVEATTVYVNGYLRSSNGPVTTFDDFTALKNFTATQGIIINGVTFTMTDPLTVTDLCTNCRLLFYQLP